MSKYKAKKMTIDGYTFDSKKESIRYLELKTLEQKGIIKNLKLQPRFELQEKFKLNGKARRKIEYIADFSYIQNGKLVVEDVKSSFTRKNPLYRIKKKLFEYKYQIEIKEEV